MSFRKLLIAVLLSVALSVPLSAQSKKGQTDSVVTLMNAKVFELFENEVGMPFRKVLDATFLHNNTYLICDSALWNVNMKIINAYGHVQIIQDRTVLSSDKMDYLIDDNLAQFRGSRVQLLDKEGNTLRTRFLDYNTKDSIAVFQRGASMRDKDGQVIESTDGDYDSKARLFTFSRNVNMYTDSVYVKTSRLLYHTDYDFAEFFGGLDAWKGKNMLSSESGTFDKANDRFFFTGDVHVMSDTQEGWSDSLYFDRTREDLEMYGHVQVMDTSRNVAALAERLFYTDSLSQVILERDATVIAETDSQGQIDTVYIGADRMVYHSEPRCDIDGNIVLAADTRLGNINSDPVAAYRAQARGEDGVAADEAEEDQSSEDISAAAAEAPLGDMMIDRESLAPMGDKKGPADALDSLAVHETEQLDSIALVEKARLDSIAKVEQARLDSIAKIEQARLDSIAAVEARARFVADSLKNRDTTAIGFLTATGNIRIFKSDMQARCDSLEYTDLDSLARLYISPIVWNEGNRQYTSDSIAVLARNQRMDRANLMSNAFIIIQEDSICFDQIKGAEIMAYFDSTTVLERFDALGGSSALFYLRENDAFATVNKVEAKMISSYFANGEIDRVYYFDSPQNDAYPVVQLPQEEKTMKGFNWQPDTRPASKEDITSLELRRAERLRYLARPMPSFPETETYFPGHMKSIARKLAQADSLRRVRHAEASRGQALQEQEAAEAAAMDSLQGRWADNSGMDELEEGLLAPVSPGDSLAAPVSAGDSGGTTVSPADSLHVAVPADSLSGNSPVQNGVREIELSPEQIAKAAAEKKAAEKAAEKAARKAESEAKREARVAAREDRWARLDERDAAKAAEKEAKALEKKRKNTLSTLLSIRKEEARDQKRLEKYIRRYEKRKERMENRKKNKQEPQ